MYAPTYAVLFASALIAGVRCTDLDLKEMESDPRVFYTNYTSSLVQVNGTLLLYGGIIVIVGAAIGLGAYLLFTSSTRRNGNYYGSYYGDETDAYSDYRGFFDNTDFNLLGLITTALETYRSLNEDDRLFD
ncbi:uncharacterized protein LOC111701878 [Eurytemora carolleeae]|uniref:uncharacterized protein LOC111701878 n=1 Tax=Eurytemora carolleeae TaxID=1294199 RepID=UPI000C780ED0|nr:uncharacterized protein LOC111701878 [Eurytemora carolleeae]|eukprot:XP_023329127.1 uncharacterized protein LOC111701878 [Eurytemora affinis]